MKKIVKFLLITLVIFVGLLVSYIYKLHLLAVEGNSLFEKRCTDVNPHLISYKKSFLEMADMINNPDKYGETDGTSAFNDYISGMRNYLNAESSWLKEQELFINRWDFKLLEPWYIKQASTYQYDMYKGYRDEAKYMLETYDFGGADEEINAKFAEARNKRQENTNLYFNFYDDAVKIRDIRKIFGTVPVPEGCTYENTVIPATEGSINWDGKPSPTPFPIDPAFVS